MGEVPRPACEPRIVALIETPFGREIPDGRGFCA